MLRVGFFFLLLLRSLGSPAQTLYGFILADTDDPLIGSGCELDVKTMEAQLSQIGDNIGYKVQVKQFRDKEFSRASIESYVRTFRCSSDDIILLYYTGHGFNMPNRSNNWPLLKMPGGNSPLSLDQLHAQLRDKQARLCVTVGDCCNDIAKPRSVSVRNLIVEDESAIKRQYAALFRNTRGDVLVASCSPGECSYADITEGSYYTKAFKTALDCAVHYNNTATWRDVLTDAQNRVMQFVGPKGRQNPVFQINLTEEPKNQTEPALSIDKVNRYLNELADERIPSAKRLGKMKDAYQFFDAKARINIYVDRTMVDAQPIEQVVERLCLNAAKIRVVNLVENQSKRGSDSQRYAVVTIQEIWEEKLVK